jgi:hypothetical protein
MRYRRGQFLLVLFALNACVGAPRSDDTGRAEAALETEIAAPVGRVEGVFAVSADGAATYRIPLAVPPGRGGMSPDLALVYDSRAGHGPLGIGWSLSGLPRITRCYEREPVSASIPEIRAIDTFCLDGVELVSDGATPDGQRYRTRPDVFAEVVALTSGPTHWRVRARDGRIYYFGSTLASRVAPRGAERGHPYFPRPQRERRRRSDQPMGVLSSCRPIAPFV